jgi:hypothetical protein
MTPAAAATAVKYHVDPAGEDIHLRFFDNCPRYQRRVESNHTYLHAQQARFEASSHAAAILAQVKQALGLSPLEDSLSWKDLLAIYDACTYVGHLYFV